MLQAVNICNQATAITQFLRAPAWPIESMNFHRYGYADFSVRLNPELQIGRTGTSLIESNISQQISPNPVLYRAMPPYIVPVSNSSPTQIIPHAADVLNDNILLPLPSSDDAFLTRKFTEHLIETGRVNIYATDKRGSRFLQKIFVAGGMPIRQKLADHFLKKDVFIKLCDHVFANFFLQKLIEEARSNEQEIIRSFLETKIVTFSRGRYSCRVVQKALECFDVTHCLSLISKLEGNEKDLSLDQNGNHVIQKIFSCVPFYGYVGIISKYVASTDILSEIVQDRYGCRVIQLSIEKLEQEVAKKSKPAISILEQLVSLLIKNCRSYSSHQFANYVVQHIITSNTLEKHRNAIICELLSNLLSMSQEKYASHVVEKALKHAPPKLLHAMMNEIFDGYECDTKGQDALDVLLFDQFGNYVIQTMLDIAVEVKEKKRMANDSWFKRLAERIVNSQHKLIRYSSGKKILEKLSAAVSNDRKTTQDENYDPSLRFLVVPKKFR